MSSATFAALASRLDRWPRWTFIAASVLAALALSIGFFSPKFWLLAEPHPGSFEWARALSYLEQCRNPFSNTVEPALRWRVLPPLAARALGLTGHSALLLP